jgi:hypothetical protein
MSLPTSPIYILFSCPQLAILCQLAAVCNCMKKKSGSEVQDSCRHGVFSNRNNITAQ